MMYRSSFLKLFHHIHDPYFTLITGWSLIHCELLLKSSSQRRWVKHPFDLLGSQKGTSQTLLKHQTAQNQSLLIPHCFPGLSFLTFGTFQVNSCWKLRCTMKQNHCLAQKGVSQQTWNFLASTSHALPCNLDLTLPEPLPSHLVVIPAEQLLETEAEQRDLMFTVYDR